MVAIVPFQARHTAVGLLTCVGHSAGSVGVTILVMGLTVQNLYVITQLPGMPANMVTFGHPFAAFSGDIE